MLVDMLEDELAPMYIIRLWGHCQNRREWIFDGMPVQATKAICRYQGDAEQFEKALIDCGFLARKEDEITIVGWDEHNASLIANWTNGLRGGRPKGSTKETRKKPMGKPKENPSDNPSGTDKIGLDRIGEEDTYMSDTPDGDAEPAVFNLPTNKYNTSGESYLITESQVDEWAEAFPACNIMGELKQMKVWLDANKSKRKTHGGMGKFVANWLSRTQNNGGSKTGTSKVPNPLSDKPSDSVMDELRRNMRHYT